MDVFQFQASDISDPIDGSDDFWFTAAMIGTCQPVFSACLDNHEVEDRLRLAGVIDETCETDTESCQLWVHFKSKIDGLAFIGRLNAHLKDRVEEIAGVWKR